MWTLRPATLIRGPISPARGAGLLWRFFRTCGPLWPVSLVLRDSDTGSGHPGLPLSSPHMQRSDGLEGLCRLLCGQPRAAWDRGACGISGRTGRHSFRSQRGAAKLRDRKATPNAHRQRRAALCR